MKERILIKASVQVKEVPGLEKITHKAVAGLTDDELIERNTIGELKEPNEGDATKRISV
jgi:hypothetical protein